MKTPGRRGRPPGSKNRAGPPPRTTPAATISAETNPDPLAELDALISPPDVDLGLPTEALAAPVPSAGKPTDLVDELNAMAEAVMGDRNDPKATRFRKGIRDLLNSKNMMELVEKRLINELTDKVDVKIFPTCARIGAGDGRETGALQKAGKIPAHIMGDMKTWSSEELREYAATGKKPTRQLIDVTPQNGAGGNA